MAEKESKIVLELGTVSYSSDVIATIAGLAAVEISGVSGMSGSFVSGITEMLGRKDFTKGVKVELNNADCTVNMSLIVEYGVDIQKVCADVQNNVHKAIDSMTGLNILAINIFVQGIFLGDNSDK